MLEYKPKRAGTKSGGRDTDKVCPQRELLRGALLKWERTLGPPGNLGKMHPDSYRCLPWGQRLVMLTFLALGDINAAGPWTTF